MAGPFCTSCKIHPARAIYIDMSERTAEKLGVPAIVALAAVAVVAYCLWGAAMLSAQEANFAQAQSTLTANY